MATRPYVAITGTGHAVPERIFTNADLEKIVETSDQWIVERTGIRERRIVAPGTPLSTLATAAAERALADSGAAAADLDLIIVGTVTGDMKFPATACLVQEKLGATKAVAFDLSAACSGFLYGLQVAEGLMLTSGYQRALVIGGDVLTSMVNWEDRDTCVLFGDGAGAVVLAPANEGRGILKTVLRSDGSCNRMLFNPGCGSLNPPTPENAREKLHTIRMEGREVFRHAVVAMVEVMNAALDQAGLSINDIDLFIPHQANLRIIEAVGKRLRFPAEKVYVNVDRFGNTSAASIPIALDEARRTGLIRPGDTVGMTTFGAGFTWASGIIRF
ncbi:MAG: beta-ketoacyl-ACP synthase III [Desulfuromonadales bacterium]